MLLQTEQGTGTGTLRSDEETHFEDKLLNELLNTRAMRRLKHIGFLGAIDYVKKGSGRSPYRRRHNRFEHSSGVAKLAEIYANRRQLCQHDRNVILCAALLHDVGHGPMSHTLEPVFEEKFGVNHHRTSRDIIRGQTKLGTGIKNILQRHSVDIEEVIAMIDGEADSEHSFLFSSQINLDTLEGITRCRAFLAPRPAFGSSLTVVAKIAKSASLPTSDFDEFWKLKHDVYNLFIHGNIGLVLDSVAQAYMREHIDQFSASDFLKTEKELKREHPYLFFLFNRIVAGQQSLRDILPRSWLETSIQVKKRCFFVDKAENLINSDSINKRYRQSKQLSSLSIEEILS